MQVFDVIYMMEDIHQSLPTIRLSLIGLSFLISFKYTDKGYGSTIVIPALGDYPLW